MFSMNLNTLNVSINTWINDCGPNGHKYGFSPTRKVRHFKNRPSPGQGKNETSPSFYLWYNDSSCCGKHQKEKKKSQQHLSLAINSLLLLCILTTANGENFPVPVCRSKSMYSQPNGSVVPVHPERQVVRVVCVNTEFNVKVCRSKSASAILLHLACFERRLRFLWNILISFSYI